MKLSRFLGKKVQLGCTNGKTYTGKIIDHIFSKDNDIDEESISLEGGYGFYESDIKSIEIVED